jgi:iron complex outermembrane recepter protein
VEWGARERFAIGSACSFFALSFAAMDSLRNQATGNTGSIDVVAASPVDASGVPRDQVPVNVQSVEAPDLEGRSLSLAMERFLPSVQLQEAQGSIWQPDVQLRGLSASPLLGVPQGVAVYQDGARLNDPFGDTVRWDLVPTLAIARLDVLPGSNPLFGFNALGGALVLQMKNGFSHPGLHGTVTGGSFGRRGLDVEWGRPFSQGAAFAALHHAEEDGWRDVSPSRASQIFGNFSWAGEKGGASFSLSGADNRLHGNGPAPVSLLAEDRDAVFTFPDESEPKSILLSGQLHRVLGPGLQAEASVSYRRQRLRTYNGDAASFAPCEAPETEAWLCREGEEDEPLRGPDGGLISSDLAADAVANRTLTNQSIAGGGLQLVWLTGGGGHSSRTVLGVAADSGRADYTSSVELARLTPDRETQGLGLDLPDERDQVESRISTRALFLLEVLSLGDSTTLTLSGRWQQRDVRLLDRIGTALNGDHSFTRLDPAAGFTRRLGTAWTLFGNVGISSRVPTPVELTCANPEDPCRLPNAFASDPPLDEVVARTTELGARGSWRGLEISAAVFRNDIRDDILFISSGALTGSGHFANVGKTRRQGAELLLRGRLPRGGSWFVSSSYLDATFQTGFSAPAPNHPDAEGGSLPVEPGDRLPLLADFTAKAGLDLAFGKARLEPSFLYLSERSLRGDEANLLLPLPAFARFDLRLSHPLGRRFVGFLEVGNLLDEEYSTFGLLGDAGEVLEDAGEDPRFISPGTPRSFLLGLRFAQL